MTAKHVMPTTTEIRRIKREARQQRKGPTQHDTLLKERMRRQRHCFWTWPWGHESMWGCSICGKEVGANSEVRCDRCGIEGHNRFEHIHGLWRPTS